MTEEITEHSMNENQPRPGFLTVLCVLSFISTGMGLLGGLYQAIRGPFSEDEMLEQKVEMTRSINDLEQLGMDAFAGMMEKLQAMAEQMNESFYLALILNLLVASSGFYAVLMMWKGRKTGFHVYIAYCLLSVASVYIYVSPSSIPTFIIIFNLIFSGLFIFLYSRNLHWMK